MKPRTKSLAAYALAALAALAVLTVAACTDPGPTAPTPVNVNVNQNVNIGQQPSTGASPSTGAGATITHVKVVQFGEDCPAGLTPSGEDRKVRNGCTKNLTCTPFVGQNLPAPESVHGPAPDFFGVTSGASCAQVTTPGNPFNRDVKGTSACSIVFSCVVKGVGSDPFVLQVIP